MQQAIPVPVQIIVTVLGSGVVAAIATAVMQNRAKREDREASYLRDQLQMLYGPLHYYTTLNQLCFEQNKKVQLAGRSELSGVNPGPDVDARKQHSEDIAAVIELANDYIEIVRDNNEQVIQILRDNYAYADPDDMNILEQFRLDYARSKTEFRSEGGIRLPMYIHQHLEDVSFMRPIFIERAGSKFLTKQKRLKALGG